jgi:hypothetical protein
MCIIRASAIIAALLLAPLALALTAFFSGLWQVPSDSSSYGEEELGI